MARYAEVADLRRYLGRYDVALTATSKPSTADADAFLDQASGEIDAVLSSRGVTVPVAAPADFTKHLRDLAAIGAAAYVIAALYPAEEGYASSSYQRDLWTRYDKGLESLRRSEGIPADVDLSTSAGPRSYWTTNPTDPESGEAWAPVFTRHTPW